MVRLSGRSKQHPHARCRVPTVRQPWVDMRDHPTVLQTHVGIGELNLIDPTTGCVCYTTPDENNARQRALAFLRHHGFRYDVLTGNYVKGGRS